MKQLMKHFVALVKGFKSTGGSLEGCLNFLAFLTFLILLIVIWHGALGKFTLTAFIVAAFAAGILTIIVLPAVFLCIALPLWIIFGLIYVLFASKYEKEVEEELAREGYTFLPSGGIIYTPPLQKENLSTIIPDQSSPVRDAAPQNAENVSLTPLPRKESLSTPIHNFIHDNWDELTGGSVFFLFIFLFFLAWSGWDWDFPLSIIFAIISIYVCLLSMFAIWVTRRRIAGKRDEISWSLWREFLEPTSSKKVP